MCNHTPDLFSLVVKETKIATTKTLYVQKKGAGAVALFICPVTFPVCHFCHISPQMTPKSRLCVGIELISFQDSRGLFWIISKPIGPATSSLLPLSLTFPQLRFPAKPVGVAKVSPT